MKGSTDEDEVYIVHTPDLVLMEGPKLLTPMVMAAGRGRGFSFLG